MERAGIQFRGWGLGREEGGIREAEDDYETKTGGWGVGIGKRERERKGERKGKGESQYGILLTKS
jgi:hypothetical protein